MINNITEFIVRLGDREETSLIMLIYGGKYNLAPFLVILPPLNTMCNQYTYKHWRHRLPLLGFGKVLVTNYCKIILESTVETMSPPGVASLNITTAQSYWGAHVLEWMLSNGSFWPIGHSLCKTAFVYWIQYQISMYIEKIDFAVQSAYIIIPFLSLFELLFEIPQVLTP